ncbi:MULTISPECIES: DUF3368 domain-containing protein [Halobacterium]|nr:MULTISPECIES: DUF3368 domain-containing protein [Halobacterium]MCG1003658.1 DUF3368 domain-containing protein [Halobacterium noricense]
MRDDEFLRLVEVERSDLFVEIFHEPLREAGFWISDDLYAQVLSEADE